MKSSYYKPLTAHIHYKVDASSFYNVVASTFKTDQMASGTITFESDQPLVLSMLPPEGQGMKRVSITDEWDHKNAGGCVNFGMYDKNPVYVLNVADEGDFQIRLKTLAEVSPAGDSLISDPEHFKFTINAALYRLPVNRYPLPQGSIDVKTLTNPALSTYSGKYTINMTGIVSEKVSANYSNYLI